MAKRRGSFSRKKVGNIAVKGLSRAGVIAVKGAPPRVEVDDRPVHPPHYEGTVLHSGRHEDKEAPGHHEFLVFEPELYLTAKICRIIKIRPEKRDNLVKRVGVGQRHVSLGRALRPDPDALYVEGTRDDLVVEPHDGGRDTP